MNTISKKISIMVFSSLMLLAGPISVADTDDDSSSMMNDRMMRGYGNYPGQYSGMGMMGRGMGMGQGMGMMGPGMGMGQGMGMMGPGMGMGQGMGMMGPGMGMGQGMGMMGPGMGYGMGMMDLTDKQRSKFRAMQREQRKSQWALRDKMMDEMDKLHDLYANETLDATAIGKVYARIFDLKQKMIEQQIKHHNSAQAMLTDKQRKEMREFRKRGMGMMYQ